MNFKKLQKNKGMTYVELIVVLSIAGIIASISLFNYKDFQDRVDMKNLANDIALKIVEAQKSSIAGKIPLTGAPSSTWKPSYGVYFDLENGTNPKKNFYLFTDLDENKGINPDDISNCPQGECTSKITLGNNYEINQLNIYTSDGSPEPTANNISQLNINFTRPNSGAIFSNKDPNTYNAVFGESVQIFYAEITLVNTRNSTTSLIRIHSSGRVEII
jgi:prepilin-type N-terminal cleavage/methylation domain-containing protein